MDVQIGRNYRLTDKGSVTPLAAARAAFRSATGCEPNFGPHAKDWDSEFRCSRTGITASVDFSGAEWCGRNRATHADYRHWLSTGEMPKREG